MAGKTANAPVELTAKVSVYLGDNLFIELVEIAALKEQDANAHIMPPAKLARLTENIRIRRQLESLPYCVQPGGEGPIEIVSGHHRVRAARGAGKTHIPALIDRDRLTRSQIVAKQLAHNALVGYDDNDILRQLLAKITDVNDLLETGLGEDMLPTPDQHKVTLFTPHADYQWKRCVFLFLPHQLENIKKLVDSVEGTPDLLILARDTQFEEFLDKVASIARAKGIISAPTAVAYLIDVAQREVDAILARKALEDKELKDLEG